jgi:peptidyl-prolyl cis-trans isomerase D
MLRGIQEASKGWVGKAIMVVVMGLLVISFAIWGIGDIFRGFGLSTVAKIGKTEISIEQFRTYYNDKLQQLSRRIGRPLTPDQARALGLDRQLMGQLIAETTLDERARELRLTLSDAEIARQITEDKNFAGPSGQFDRQRFEALIRNANFTEARYVAEQRRLMIRRELAETISGDIKAPSAMVQAVARFQNEERSIDYVLLSAAQAGDVPAPSAEQLGKYFDERKIQFRAPEYRKITLVQLTPADLAKWQNISDADARKIYDQNADKFGTPERRDVRQIVFPNADEAKAAADKIAKGATFDAIATDRGLKPSDTDLGLVGKSALIDPAVADAVFALKSGETSAPVQGRFGTVIAQVRSIEPAQLKRYEDVAQQIKTEIATNQARKDINDLQNKIEDARAGGATLAEAAEKAGVAVRTIEAIDRSGRTPDGEPVPNLPQGIDFISGAFAAEVGVETDPLQIPGGGYLWFDVVSITPARERPLEEVKAQVEQRWRDDEISKRLKAKADAMAEKLKSGAKFEDVAKADGAKAEKATGIKRAASGANVPPTVVETVFKTPKDGNAVVEGLKPTELFVLRVTAVDDPKFDAASEEAKKIAEGVRPGYADSVLSEYVLRLEADYGVNINPAAFNQIVSGQAANQ